MAITQTWSVKSMQTVGNVVATVEYELNSTDGSISFTTDGYVVLDSADPENFIEYGNLSEEVVLGWVFAKLGSKRQSFELNHLDRMNPNGAAQNAPATQALPW